MLWPAVGRAAITAEMMQIAAGVATRVEMVQDGNRSQRDSPPRPNVVLDTERFKELLRAAGPPLLFGLHLWASVCLALSMAFVLELDTPSWAGTTAAIVCQPHLGASLRKGFG